MLYTIDEDGIHFYTEEKPPQPIAPAPEVPPPEMTLQEALVIIAKIVKQVEALGT